MKYLMNALAICVTFAGLAFADPFVEGTGSANCCEVSPDRISSAKALLDQIHEVPENQLELRMTLGEVCTIFDCGVLSEDDAKRVILASLARSDRKTDRNEKLALAALALIVGGAGLWVNILNRYRPRSAKSSPKAAK